MEAESGAVSDNQAWVVAEIADDGDPERALEAVQREGGEWLSAQREGGSVVIHSGRPLAEGNGIELPYPVSDHVSRVVIVDSIEGSEGQTRSRPYREFREVIEPDDRLSSVTRWFVQSRFDYYAGQYGIDGAV